MNNMKVPCGGFYLDDSLMFDEKHGLGVASNHDALTVKFTPNTEPDAKDGEFICDTPLMQIVEALYTRKIPVNGLVYTNDGEVFSISLSTCDFGKGKCVFSAPASIYRVGASGGSLIIKEISFQFLTLTSRSIGGNDIYKMSEAIMNVGDGGGGPV